MKFVPRRDYYRPTFCTANHWVLEADGTATCKECGCDVTDAFSIHMQLAVDDDGQRERKVLLCLTCAEEYRQFLAMEKVVGT